MDVLLTTATADLGLAPADRAAEQAQLIANEMNEVVTWRDATTDRQLGRAKPDGSRRK